MDICGSPESEETANKGAIHDDLLIIDTILEIPDIEYKKRTKANRFGNHNVEKNSVNTALDYLKHHWANIYP